MLFEEALDLYPKRTRRILLAIYGALAAAAIIILATEVYKEGHYGILNKSFPLIMVILLALIFTTKIKVSLTPEVLTVKSGMMKRRVPASNIKSVRIEECDRSKAGWRWARYGYGTRYKGVKSYITGDAKRGLWIELYSGDPFFVSSERPEELMNAVNAAIGNISAEAQN